MPWQHPRRERPTFFISFLLLLTEGGLTSPSPIPNWRPSGFASSTSLPILLVPVSPDASRSANRAVSRCATDSGGLDEAVGDIAFAAGSGIAAALPAGLSSLRIGVVCSEARHGGICARNSRLHVGGRVDMAR